MKQQEAAAAVTAKRTQTKLGGKDSSVEIDALQTDCVPAQRFDPISCKEVLQHTTQDRIGDYRHLCMFDISLLWSEGLENVILFFLICLFSVSQLCSL